MELIKNHSLSFAVACKTSFLAESSTAPDYHPTHKTCNLTNQRSVLTNSFRGSSLFPSCIKCGRKGTTASVICRHPCLEKLFAARLKYVFASHFCKNPIRIISCKFSTLTFGTYDAINESRLNKEEGTKKEDHHDKRGTYIVTVIVKCIIR